MTLALFLALPLSLAPGYDQISRSPFLYDDEPPCRVAYLSPKKELLIVCVCQHWKSCADDDLTLDEALEYIRTGQYPKEPKIKEEEKK